MKTSIDYQKTILPDVIETFNIFLNEIIAVLYLYECQRCNCPKSMQHSSGNGYDISTFYQYAFTIKHNLTLTVNESPDFFSAVMFLVANGTAGKAGAD